MSQSEPEDRGSRPSLPRSVRVIAGVAIVLFWGVLLTLRLAVGLPLLDSLLLTALLVAVPGLSLAQLPLIEHAPLERLEAYWSSIATLWLLGTASWFVGTRDGGAAGVGLAGMTWGGLASWTVGLAAGGLLTVVAFRQLSMWTGKLDSRLLRQLLPRTRQERAVFGVLSLAAGFGEEIAYRGYAITTLVPLIGAPAAAVLTSVVFGMLHGYQGALGILRTGVMGGMLAWGFLASGSLWPPILAHTAIDLVAGLWLGERLLSPRSV
ncbi:MAG: CPBP family intramembrane metalloprotease [Gemmatimonadota bacterium]